MQPGRVRPLAGHSGGHSVQQGWVALGGSQLVLAHPLMVLGSAPGPTGSGGLAEKAGERPWLECVSSIVNDHRCQHHGAVTSSLLGCWEHTVHPGETLWRLPAFHFARLWEVGAPLRRVEMEGCPSPCSQSVVLSWAALLWALIDRSRNRTVVVPSRPISAPFGSILFFPTPKGDTCIFNFSKC